MPSKFRQSVAALQEGASGPDKLGPDNPKPGNPKPAKPKPAKSSPARPKLAKRPRARKQRKGGLLSWVEIGWPGRVRRIASLGAAAIVIGVALALVVQRGPEHYFSRHHDAPSKPPVRTADQPAPTPPVVAPAIIAAAPELLYEEPGAEGPAAAPAAREQPPVRVAKPALRRDGGQAAFVPPAGLLPPWLRNAAAMPETGERPLIAIVIDDVGLDRRHSDEAVALPRAFTLSFLPYAADVARQAEVARARGHEIMVHVPMEPESPRVDPGPHALRVATSVDGLRRDIAWNLDQFTGYVAANNHMGSRFTRDAEGMREVLAALRARGVFFLDSRTTPSTVGPLVATELGLPHLQRDVFLDNIELLQDIAGQLAGLERVARRDGYAIAIGHPHESTLAALAHWAPAAEARGFALVPISVVMRKRLAAEGAPQLQQAATGR